MSAVSSPPVVRPSDYARVVIDRSQARSVVMSGRGIVASEHPPRVAGGRGSARGRAATPWTPHRGQRRHGRRGADDERRRRRPLRHRARRRHREVCTASTRAGGRRRPHAGAAGVGRLHLDAAAGHPRRDGAGRRRRLGRAAPAFGVLPWRQVLEPAIAIAQEGFPVSELVSLEWQGSESALDAHANSARIRSCPMGGRREPASASAIPTSHGRTSSSRLAGARRSTTARSRGGCSCSNGLGRRFFKFDIEAARLVLGAHEVKRGWTAQPRAE